MTKEAIIGAKWVMKLHTTSSHKVEYSHKFLTCSKSTFIFQKKICFICFIESSLNTMRSTYFILKAIFVLKILKFVLTFWSFRKKLLIKKISLTSKLWSHNLLNKQLQYAHCSISHKVNKGNQTMKSCQLIEYSKTFFFINHAEN